MNKFILLNVVAFFGLMLFSFQVEQDPEIEKARTWFHDRFEYPTYLGLPVKPEWNLVRKIRRTPNHRYYEVPLDELIIADIGNPFSNQGGNDFQSANGYVKLIVEEFFGDYVAYFIRLNGSKVFVSQFGRDSVQSTTFDKISQKFSGKIEFIGMDGVSIEGLLISEGQAVGTVRTQSDTTHNAQATNDRCWSCDVITYVNWTVGGYLDANGSMQWGAAHGYYTSQEVVCQNYGAYCDGGIYGLSQEQATNQAWMTYYQTGYLPGHVNPNIINPPIVNCCEIFAMQLDGGTFSNYWVEIDLNTQLTDIECSVPQISGHVSADVIHMSLPTNYEITNSQVFLTSKTPNPNGACGYTVGVKAECDMIMQYIVVVGFYAYGATYHYEHKHEGVQLR